MNKLETENRNLKQASADMAPENQTIKDLLGKLSGRHTEVEWPAI